ncbi:MAG TPA: hypothetical protein VIJ51_01250 [Solirubrobacteraceae bacterium]
MGRRAAAIRGAASRYWAASLFGLALLTSLTWLLAGTSSPSLATTTSVSVTQGSLKLTPSASPQAGSPITITESGEVGVTSTLAVFAQAGQACLASQGQEAAGGALRVDQRVIPAGAGPFTATGQFTPATAGTYYVCGYLDGASDGSVEDQTVSIAVVVAPAPTPPSSPPAAGPTQAASGPAVRPCVVPALARHTLAGAKHVLAASGCSLGVILQPTARGLSRERRKPGGKSLVLVVGSQFPAAGTGLRANQYVAIRLVLGKAPGTRGKAGAK